MLTTLGAIVMLALSAPGGHGHHEPREGCCEVCGVETQAILAEIQCLQTNPKWRRRNDAAHDLRKFDWHCHPEVVSALATALLTDGHEEVREEAAQSLAKLAPCLPEAHQALMRAADCDPDHSTRHWARKALKKLKGRCEGTCVVCGPAPGAVEVPNPVGEPLPAPARIIVPPDLGPLDGPAPGPRPPVSPGGSSLISPPEEDLRLEPPLREGRREGTARRRST